VAALEVARRVELSVAEAVDGESRVAVAFSGGLDSSLVVKCAMKRADVVACSAFANGAADAHRAPAAAAALGVGLVTTELTARSIEVALGELDLPFIPTLMDRSLWCLYKVVSERAHDLGARVLLLGQLADELFGGYAKYAEVLEVEGEEAVRSMMNADVRGFATRGRIRDIRACAPWAEARFPFELQGLVELASMLPISFKIRGGVRKAVLRRAASVLGVPEELAGASKKAAQYSSGVQKLVVGSPF
jgi:asparagine synthase (glutamine-hydrolysing)